MNKISCVLIFIFTSSTLAAFGKTLDLSANSVCEVKIDDGSRPESTNLICDGQQVHATANSGPEWNGHKERDAYIANLVRSGLAPVEIGGCGHIFINESITPSDEDVSLRGTSFCRIAEDELHHYTSMSCDGKMYYYNSDLRSRARAIATNGFLFRALNSGFEISSCDGGEVMLLNRKR